MCLAEVLPLPAPLCWPGRASVRARPRPHPPQWVHRTCVGSLGVPHPHRRGFARQERQGGEQDAEQSQHQDLEPVDAGECEVGMCV